MNSPKILKISAKKQIYFFSENIHLTERPLGCIYYLFFDSLLKK